MNNKAIGVFDSGIGGLTVVKSIKKILPNEQIIYFGDTKHLPYGDKSKDTLISYSLEIANFLIKQDVKAIVIACNTASAMAFEQVKKLAGNIPVYNVIDPVVDYIIENNKQKDNIDVGLIATKATINSKVYESKISSKNKNIKTYSLATPMLVPMIEEGFHNDKISKAIIENYLKNEKLSKIKTLILGCTHYPLIEKEIYTFYKGNVDVLNSACIVATEIKKSLTKKKMLNTDNIKTKDIFYISDFTKSFEKTAKIIFSENINLEKIKI